MIQHLITSSHSMLTIAIVACALVVLLAVYPESEAQARELLAVRVTVAKPVVDGTVDDEVWQRAKTLPLTVERKLPPNKGSAGKAWLQAAYTDTHLYAVLSWEDDAPDVSHKTWTWNTSRSAFEEGSDREDMAAIAFELEGPFTADMLSPVEAIWDVWHWKAFRSNPQGYATDKTHHYLRSIPNFKANEHTANDGQPIWIARPEDKGASAEASRPGPGKRTHDKVPQFLPTTPSGSAADVRAKGQWAKGRWTVEFARSLNTGHEDDAVFRPDRCHPMAVATFNHTGNMDKASDLIHLCFDHP